MRISRSFPLCVATTILSSAEGFTKTWTLRPTPSIPSWTTTTTSLGVSTEVSDQTKANDFGSAMPAEVDPHDIIGVKPDELALGINPSDFLEWVGT